MFNVHQKSDDNDVVFKYKYLRGILIVFVVVATFDLQQKLSLTRVLPQTLITGVGKTLSYLKCLNSICG